MSSNLDWLPSDLEIVALRIARADECAYAIAQLAGQWSYDEPIVLEQTRASDRFTTKVKAIRPIPPRIPLLFSEAVNHLRAALDNVVWFLAEQALGRVAAKTASKVALPIHVSPAAFDAWQRDRIRRGLTAFDAAAPLGQRIHALQPFVDQTSFVESVTSIVATITGMPREVAHPLQLLQVYSNADKHRTIRTVVSRTSGGVVEPYSAGPTDRAWRELRVGDVVSEGVWGKGVGLEMTTAVMIPRPSPFTALVSPANEVSRLCVYVAHTAVPTLVTGSAIPGSLPLHVDLDASEVSDRDRLGAGDTTSAQDRVWPWMAQKYREAESRPVAYLPTEDSTPDTGG